MSILCKCGHPQDRHIFRQWFCTVDERKPGSGFKGCRCSRFESQPNEVIGNMAEPKLEVDRRLDRIELAIGTMAQWLVQAQTGFGAHDADGIEKILRGETPPNKEESEENAS